MKLAQRFTLRMSTEKTGDLTREETRLGITLNNDAYFYFHN
ncbi:hypothetical protein BH24DEI2_BH24DEI2_18490 [soil metagenome]